MKVKVLLVNDASPTDPKSNLKIIREITRCDDGTRFAFPEPLQPITVHPKLAAHPTIVKVLTQIKRRNQFRNVVITLDDETESDYFDEDGNACFREFYLPEASEVPSPPVLVEDKKRSTHSLAKDFVLDKFTGKYQNPYVWIKLFEAECSRLNVQDDQFVEMFRTFLEGNAVTDWFAINLQIYSLSTPWSEWRTQFCEDFTPKGWKNVFYAYNYKYSFGSFADFALRKLRLLIDADPNLPTLSRINLVVMGLPEVVQNRIDRNEVENQSDLLAKLQALESFAIPAKKNTPKLQPKYSKGENNEQVQKQKKFCSLCHKHKRIYNNHTDLECGYNPVNWKDRTPSMKESSEKKTIKVANNVELEQVLNENLPASKN